MVIPFFSVIVLSLVHPVVSVDWSEQYTVDPRRSALVWTTGLNISLVICPQEFYTVRHEVRNGSAVVGILECYRKYGSTTTPPTGDHRAARADYSVALDLAPDVALPGETQREHRRREERIKTIFESVIGDIRIINQDRARLIGELIGEVISKCVRDTPAGDESSPGALEPSFIDGLVVPLGGAIGRLFLERPPPVEQMAERHLDFDLGANTFMRVNSMQNNTAVRHLISETHWEAFARYGVKLLGNTLTREEYLDAVGFAVGLTMSLTHQLNGTVVVQDVATTARKYVGNFLRAYLLMSNQYYSFMDHSISWLADDIAAYTSSDIFRVRDPSGITAAQEEWPKYAAEASKGLKSLRLISIAMLLSYRNDAGDIKFQPAETMGTVVPPSWMILRYLLPGV